MFTVLGINAEKILNIYCYCFACILLGSPSLHCLECNGELALGLPHPHCNGRHPLAVIHVDLHLPLIGRD